MPEKRVRVQAKTDWQDSDARPHGDIQITPPGKHYLQDHLDHTKQEQTEYRAKVLRDMGGRKRDARRIPPAEYQLSGRTSKSSSRIRFPSQLFRERYGLIDWSGG